MRVDLDSHMEQPMKFEIRLRSTLKQQSNAALQNEVLAAQAELDEMLRTEIRDVTDDAIETVDVQPEGAFPGAVEVLLITLIVTFGTGIAKGIAKGAGEGFGEEVGKPLGQHAGKLVGAKIRAWLQRRWPDAEIVSVETKD